MLWGENSLGEPSCAALVWVCLIGETLSLLSEIGEGFGGLLMSMCGGCS